MSDTDIPSSLRSSRDTKVKSFSDKKQTTKQIKIADSGPSDT